MNVTEKGNRVTIVCTDAELDDAWKYLELHGYSFGGSKRSGDGKTVTITATRKGGKDEQVRS